MTNNYWNLDINNKWEHVEDEMHSKGYLMYPFIDDKYNEVVNGEHIDYEDIPRLKKSEEDAKPVADNEQDAEQDRFGNDLDIPGSELDDRDEEIGSEDEENNYYSLGGDNHDNLEEDKGE